MAHVAYLELSRDRISPIYICFDQHGNTDGGITGLSEIGSTVSYVSRKDSIASTEHPEQLVDLEILKLALKGGVSFSLLYTSAVAANPEIFLSGHVYSNGATIIETSPIPVPTLIKNLNLTPPSVGVMAVFNGVTRIVPATWVHE